MPETSPTLLTPFLTGPGEGGIQPLPISGFPKLEPNTKEPDYYNVIKYYGEPAQRVPQDVLRRRKLSLETMKRVGTPVLIKKKYTIDDVARGIATESTNFSSIYKQSPYRDELSWGTGYCSIEVQPGEWIDSQGKLHIRTYPEEGWAAAPKYKGYGPGYLTYAIIPDAPEDVFRLTAEGALLHTQLTRTQLPWWPLCADNDILITCELDQNYKIIETYDRYQLKKVTPITMRGLDRQGQREFRADASGNRFWVGAYCEANKVFSETDPIYSVETDR